ncbi:MAG TPA: ABC transporter substrate-binding protein [Methylomirabilota bacterium]|nr:ABC transporter substrate-binding protein [Methylomirabilota bacterium]
MVIGLVLGVLSGSALVEAQQAGKVYRIGLLDYGSPEAGRVKWWKAFRERLRDLDYVEGRNVSFEPRWGRGNRDQLQTQAAELVALKVDVIVTASGAASIAAKRATSTIPIVSTIGPDPVGLGIVTSLARPGGNVTGLTSISSELSGKRLELVRAIAPRASRVAILWHEGSPGNQLNVKETEAAAGLLGATLQAVGVRGPEEFDRTFQLMRRDGAGAVLIVPNAMFFTHRKRLGTLALNHRLISIVGSREYVEAGGLASYATDFPHLFRRAAEYVDRVVKGANPSDMPIEQPTKFELIINLQTAKALGLTIPESVLLRADEVIR